MGRIPDLEGEYDMKPEIEVVYNTDPKLIQLLTDIWHNQATIIKWLDKIEHNTKK